jgi:hypothetical protein
LSLGQINALFHQDLNVEIQRVKKHKTFENLNDDDYIDLRLSGGTWPVILNTN